MSSAHALDALSLDFGRGTRGVGEWRIGAQWRQEPKWLDDTLMRLYWDAGLGTWESDLGTLQDLGLTPTFRYGHERGGYFDFGIGYRFDRYDVSLRLQHLSNAGIKNPNPGINFLQLRFQYWLK